MRQRLAEALRVFGSFLVDPPGWIPAWVMTAVYLALLERSLENPERNLPVAAELGRTLVATLSIWLGYKGLGGLWRVLQLWKGGKEE